MNRPFSPLETRVLALKHPPFDYFSDPARFCQTFWWLLPLRRKRTSPSLSSPGGFRLTTPTPLIQPPAAWRLLTEVRAILELGTYFPSLPFLRTIPEGDGHPVIVYPCFLATNRATAAMRYFLKDRGYQVYGWHLGRNQGYSPAMGAMMETVLRNTAARHGCKVSLIGWSLGGIYARELARAAPECVRQVITLGSPFAHAQKASNVGWLYNWVSGERMEAMDSRMMRLMIQPPPVPSTAIFSRGDGVVDWTCAMERRSPQTDNIEVSGSHCGLGHNPMALYAIGDRLAQSEHAWSHFDRSGLRAFFYPDPYRIQDPLLPPPSRIQPEGTWAKRIDALDQALARLTEQKTATSSGTGSPSKGLRDLVRARRKRRALQQGTPEDWTHQPVLV